MPCRVLSLALAFLRSDGADLRDGLDDERLLRVPRVRRNDAEVVISAEGQVDSQRDDLVRRNHTELGGAAAQPGPDAAAKTEDERGAGGPPPVNVRQTEALEQATATAAATPASPSTVRQKSLVEMAQSSESSAGAGNPPFLKGAVRFGGALCAGLLGLGVAISRFCTDCWHKWPCCRRARQSLGLEERLSIDVTVHKARDLGSKPLAIAIVPRRGSKKPKFKTGPTTAFTKDLLWEQTLSGIKLDGCDLVQVCAVKKVLTKESLLGWGDLRIEDLKRNDGLCKDWVALEDEGGKQIGTVCLTLRLDRPKEDEDSETESPDKDEAKEPQALDSQLQECAQAITGPLNQANKLGEYKMRYFRAEQKRGIWIWSWYKEKNPREDSKPLGRMPVLAICGVKAVPSSIGEFIVHYRDATNQVATMLLERCDRPREEWVDGLQQMVEAARQLRQRDKAQKTLEKLVAEQEEKDARATRYQAAVEERSVEEQRCDEREEEARTRPRTAAPRSTPHRPTAHLSLPLPDHRSA